jgi:hypothetical protein
MLCTLAGCKESAKRELLTVEFQPDTVLKYKLVSERDITLDLRSEDPRVKEKNKPQTMREKLEMVIAYKPVEVDPFGLTIIEGTVKSAKVTRTSFTAKASSKDAAEELAGQTFTIKLTPTGQIADHESLTALVRKTGEKAFATNTAGKQRIKDPDMIYDFIALQWYLWDSVATIEEPLDGVRTGQSWKAVQLIPLPVPIKVARETTYTLDGVEQTPQGRKATITSCYDLSEETLENWPNPYSGRYAMRGMFGFLRGYKYESIEGTGTQMFDVDSGVVEKDEQQYKMKMSAQFMLALGDSVPVITIDQKITAELLDR